MARLEFLVVFQRGKWRIDHNGEHYGPYDSQLKAFRAAIDKADSAGLNGHEAKVLVEGNDKRFRTEWTHGIDPYPPL